MVRSQVVNDRGELQPTQQSLDLLRPYLPRLLIDWLADAPEERWREIDGTVAFVDISGFTKLSERLAKRGKVGAEELTDAISGSFSRLLGVAYGEDGGLIKFGGDALLLFFTGGDHEAKACRAALGMRRALREIGALSAPGGKVALKMSVGVHSGTFNFFLVGESHKELIVTGPAASETVLMEGTADAGQIVVSAATARAVPSGALGAAKGPGYLLKREFGGLSVDLRKEPPQPSPDLLSTIPTALREHLLAGLDEPEHRRVTIAFIHFDGADALIGTHGAAAAGDELHALVTDVQGAADTHGVAFLGSDIDRDGGKIILAAGAPSSSENDRERMLLALRDIIGPDRAITVRAGVNEGYVFAGNVGPTYRRTYTVMGDAVNLAARMMAKGQAGQLLATEELLSDLSTRFETTPLEPFMVKGKSKPVRAVVIGTILGAEVVQSVSAGPFVGRSDEMLVAMEALADARAGRGQLLEIVGDPGIGKSRLIEELQSQAGGTVQLTAACFLYSQSIPYYPVRGIMRQALGIPADAPDDAAAEILHSALSSIAPDLLPWMPLVAIPLDISVPSTSDVNQLGDEFKQARIVEVTMSLLARLLTTPALIVIDDAHWMDDASSAWLRGITSGLGALPWLVCVTRRNVDDGFVAEQGETVVQLRPRPLDVAAAGDLIDALTEEEPIQQHEADALAQRSGGNPLFLRELLQAVGEAGSVEGLPGSVEALIAARIDWLGPEERSVLRRISVLGPTFTKSLASVVMPDFLHSSADSIWRRLGSFVTSDRHDTVTFRSALIRDVAYEGLPYRLRQKLHAIVGEKIEDDCGARADDQAELLSLHFFHAHRFEDAWRYSRIAAERARGVYANVEAAGFYERSLAAAKRIGAVAKEDIAGVYEALGDVRRLIGDFTKADAAYRLARQKLADPLTTSRVLLKEVVVQRQLGRFRDALGWLRKADKVAPALEGAEAARQRARTAVEYAGVYSDQGRPFDVIRWCMRAIPDAEGCSDPETLARALMLLDNAYMALGNWDRATNSPRALALYEELGNLGGQAVVLNNMGGQAYFQGRWDEALELYERGRLARERTGDAVNAAYGTVNEGEILSDQGRTAEAELLFKKALRVWKAAGDRAGVAYVLSNLGRLDAREARFDEAHERLLAARSESEELGLDIDVLEADARIAECLALQGNAGEALNAADRALEVAMSAHGGSAAQTPMLYRVRGWALAQLGDVMRAQDALHESVQAARGRNAQYDVALGLRGIAALSVATGAPDEDAAIESDLILRQLGVERVVEPAIVGPC